MKLPTFILYLSVKSPTKIITTLDLILGGYSISCL